MAGVSWARIWAVRAASEVALLVAVDTAVVTGATVTGLTGPTGLGAGVGAGTGAGATSFCPAPARAASTAEPICPSSWATTVDTTEFSSTLELEEEAVEEVEAGLEAVCWAGAVPTVVQALHSPTELELKELELS